MLESLKSGAARQKDNRKKKELIFKYKNSDNKMRKILP